MRIMKKVGPPPTCFGCSHHGLAICKKFNCWQRHLADVKSEHEEEFAIQISQCSCCFPYSRSLILFSQYRVFYYSYSTYFHASYDDALQHDVLWEVSFLKATPFLFPDHFSSFHKLLYSSLYFTSYMSVIYRYFPVVYVSYHSTSTQTSLLVL